MAVITGLVSYWKMDEASGNALDAHGSNDLTDNNTVGSATGILGNARDFEFLNSEWFNHTDNADLSVGDIDFQFSCWVKLESKTANMFILGKSADISSDATIAYLLSYSLVSDTFRFTVGNGTTSAAVFSTNFGSPSTGVWYFITVWHDAAGNTVNISVNDISETPTSYSGGSYNDTGDFAIGTTYSGGSAFGLYFDGLIDEVGFFKTLKTSGERTSLYGGGTPPPYPFSLTNLKTLNGLAKASVKTINGLAIANVKSYNGIA